MDMLTESTGTVELVVDEVQDSEIKWRETETKTPKSDLNDDLPPLSEGDLVKYDSVTGTFTLLG